MIPKPFNEVASADIQQLVADQVPEGRTIEYKEQLPGNGSEEKKEFLADVSSFANASGGDIVYGIEERRDGTGRASGLPANAKGLATLTNADSEIRRLQQTIRDNIEPRIPGVQIKAIPGLAEGPAILIRIERSWNSPHMLSGSPRFFSRASNGKTPLDVTEIRAAFVQSETLPARIRQFRDDRIARILAGETPILVPHAATIVMHLIPISNFHSGSPVDVQAVSHGSVHLPPLGATGWDGRINFDGYVTFDRASLDDPAVSYTQLFRNGAIEAVDVWLLDAQRANQRMIPAVAYEEHIIRSFSRYLEAYRTLGVNGPIVVLLSFLGVNGYRMSSERSNFRGNHPIDRDVLILPEVVIEELNDAPGRLLRPAFDLVWQACGCAGSRNYNEVGDWVGMR